MTESHFAKIELSLGLYIIKVLQQFHKTFMQQSLAKSPKLQIVSSLLKQNFKCPYLKYAICDLVIFSFKL